MSENLAAAYISPTYKDAVALVLFMAVTVVPWALAVLVVSIFAKGNVVYWMCVGWLRTAIWGAKVICGVRARLHGFDRYVPSSKSLGRRLDSRFSADKVKGKRGRKGLRIRDDFSALV